MKFTENEWETIKKVAEITVELDDMMKEADGYAEFTINGNTDAIEILVSTGPKKGERYSLWWQHKIFYHNNPVFVPHYMFEHSVKDAEELYEYCAAHLPEWKEELK